MSDSEDLGGFSPTTPLPHPRQSKKPRKNANLEAGPSSKSSRAHKAAGARKIAANPRKKQPQPDDKSDSDVQEIIREDEVEQTEMGNPDEDIEMVDVAKGKQGSAGSATGALTALNGKSAGKGKGKGKAKAPAAKTKTSASPEATTINVDAAEELEDEMNMAQETARAIAIAHGGGFKDKNSREVAKLQERLRRSQEQVHLLTEKLEETHRIRDTEAEKLMKALDDQYQIELKSKEALIEGLSSQLAQKEPLTSGILHMITREAADEAQRKLLRENDQLRDQLKEREVLIAKLRQIESDLQTDLKAEIERANRLSDKSHRTPQTDSRGRVGGTAFEDPKNTQVIRFYEDLTNLLVTNMKHQAGSRPGADDWTLKCIYTYSEDDVMQKSVAFTLRTIVLGKNDAGSDPNEQSIQYTPDDLDKEPPDFVERLGFLNQPFSFSKKQLSLFLRTLYDCIKEALKSESDDDVQIVDISH